MVPASARALNMASPGGPNLYFFFFHNPPWGEGLVSYMCVLTAAEEPVSEIEPSFYEKITLTPDSAHRSPCYRPTRRISTVPLRPASGP